MEYYDTHAHYDDEHFDSDRNEVIKRIYKAGVTKCNNVGCDIETSKKAIDLSKKYDFIYAICGIHPSEILAGKQEITDKTQNSKSKIDEQILQIKGITH